MSSKYRIIPLGGGGGITPTGTLDIRSEGVFDVTDYASVDVDIFDDTTTKTITNNGTYNASDDQVLGYSQVTVAVPASAVDTGTKSISANGTGIDVVGYAAVDVNVQNGTETITVTNNGIYTPTSPNVGFAEVTVSVPASAVDSGTLQTTITTAGTTTVNVVGYASHEIAVNIQPSIQTMTQQQYDALPVKDPDTIYLIS